MGLGCGLGLRFLRPCRGGGVGWLLSTGCARSRTRSLHPWLHAGAPSGRVGGERGCLWGVLARRLACCTRGSRRVGGWGEDVCACGVTCGAGAAAWVGSEIPPPLPGRGCWLVVVHGLRESQRRLAAPVVTGRRPFGASWRRERLSTGCAMRRAVLLRPSR